VKRERADFAGGMEHARRCAVRSPKNWIVTPGYETEGEHAASIRAVSVLHAQPAFGEPECSNGTNAQSLTRNELPAQTTVEIAVRSKTGTGVGFEK
jgi:hypothetical protein